MSIINFRKFMYDKNKRATRRKKTVFKHKRRRRCAEIKKKRLAKEKRDMERKRNNVKGSAYSHRKRS